jgi:hypothetical protein
VLISRIIETLLRLVMLFQFRSPLSFTAGDAIRRNFPAPIRVRVFARRRGPCPDQGNSFFCP